METETKEPLAIVKEIKVANGVFPLKSPVSNKFSAVESYREHAAQGRLPQEAPREFREAAQHIFYAPRNREVVSYNLLHEKIAVEKEKLSEIYPAGSPEETKKILVEASKNILKEAGINSETLLIYSPVLSAKLAEEDEFTRITVTFDRDESILLVKTVLIRKQDEFKTEIEADEQLTGLLEDEPVLSEAVSETVPADIEHDEEELKRARAEELKKKYNFHRPQGESIRDILNKKNKPHEVLHEEEKHKTPEEQFRDFIAECLHTLSGNWKGDDYVVNLKESGYLVPVQLVNLERDQLVIKSSPITNIEWWTKFTPINQCPRFEGALNIPDAWAPHCKAAQCNQACGAEDGFVELSAARFRLIEESEIISNNFKRLQEFLDRAYRLIDEFKGTFEVDIHLDVTTSTPYLYAMLDKNADENVIRNYFEAFITMYSDITDVRGKIDIEEFSIDEDYDPVSEDGLVHEARNYALQEMVRLAAKDILKDIVRDKDGSIEGNFYLIEKGRLRYILRSDRVECFRDELYMGNINFKKGLNEVQHYFVTTLGGGRW